MRVATVLAVAGCGRIGFAPLAVVGDATADVATIDAPRPCAVWNDFGAPVIVPIPGNIAHYMGNVTDDGLLAMFADYNSTTLDDLYVATRASTADAFAAEALIGELQTTDNDNNAVTRDGLTVYFAREVGATPSEIMITTRATLADTFAPPVAVAELNSTGRDNPGWLSPDGLRMYMASDRAGDLDLYVADRATTAAPFGAPVAFAELAGNGDDMNPTLTSDELEIIWSSKRATARFDLYHATRASRSDPFGAPAPLTSLNTANDDCFGSLSPDGTTLYFNYDMLTAGGPADLWMAKRTCAN
jgi:hypothetical protein